MNATTVSYIVTGLQPGNVYTFRIEAGDPSGLYSTDGPRTSLVTTPLTIPTAISNALMQSFQEYWYIAIPGPGLIIVSALTVLVRRVKRS